MPIKLTTLLAKVQNVRIKENAELINQFYAFMKNNNSSESHIANNLKVIVKFSNYFNLPKCLQI